MLFFYIEKKNPWQLGPYLLHGISGNLGQFILKEAFSLHYRIRH